MPLKPKLNKFSTASPILATYPYTDIIEGTGIIKFYLASTEDNDGEDYILNSKTIYSEHIEEEFSTSHGETYYRELDLDYDLTPFNSARTIKGKCFVNFSIKVTDAGSGHGGYCYYVVKIRKYSATTETEIANNRTREYITTVGADTGEHLISFEIDATETNFKIGDILRVTIEGWAKRSDHSYPGGTFKYYTDPQNENGTGTIPTTFEVYMPFKLEV